MNSLTHVLHLQFQKDLGRLRNEIAAYQDESNLWKTEHGIANSAGNLCLHLVGNLNTYFGTVLGKTGYVRNREQEFSLKGIPKSQLLASIDAVTKVVADVLASVDDKTLYSEYPMHVLEQKTSTEYFFIHLLAHLSYHLGQINYHRRLIDQR